MRPGVSFLFALTGDAAWTRFALDLLRRALAEWGVGGKTAAGYGRFSFEGSDAAVADERQTAERWGRCASAGLEFAQASSVELSLSTGGAA